MESRCGRSGCYWARLRAIRCGRRKLGDPLVGQPWRLAKDVRKVLYKEGARHRAEPLIGKAERCYTLWEDIPECVVSDCPCVLAIGRRSWRERAAVAIGIERRSLLLSG